MYAFYSFIVDESSLFKQHISRYLRYFHEQKLFTKVVKAETIEEVGQITKQMKYVVQV